MKVFKGITFLFVLGVGACAFAQSNYEENHPNFTVNHPRRAELVQKHVNEEMRIKNGEAAGTISQSEAAELQYKDNELAAQQEQEVIQNGGHLTKAQQSDLDAQRQQLSQEIYDDRHP